MIFKLMISWKRGGHMEREQMEYWEQRLFGFAKRDDVEKLRQETSAHFRKLREEYKEWILKWSEGVLSELEGLKKEGKVDMGPFLKALREEIEKLEGVIPSMFLQSVQPIESKIKEEILSILQPFQQEMESTFKTMKEETVATFLRLRQDMISAFQTLREEERANFIKTDEEWKIELHRFRHGIENLKNLIQVSTGEITVLNERVRDGFIEVREELGAMIKFSHADLDKRIAALEARVKALEKMVLP